MAARLPIRTPSVSLNAMQFRGNIGGIDVEDSGTVEVCILDIVERSNL